MSDEDLVHDADSVLLVLPRPPQALSRTDRERLTLYGSVRDPAPTAAWQLLHDRRDEEGRHLASDPPRGYWAWPAGYSGGTDVREGAAVHSWHCEQALPLRWQGELVASGWDRLRRALRELELRDPDAMVRPAWEDWNPGRALPVVLVDAISYRLATHAILVCTGEVAPWPSDPELRASLWRGSSP